MGGGRWPSSIGAMARAKVTEMPESSRAAGRALGVLFMIGGALGALTLLLPHPATFHDGALWGNTVLAFVAGGVLVAVARHFPVWFLHLTLAIGTLVITRAVYYSEEPSGYYAFYYIWVGFYAFFFFGRAGGLFHMTIVGGAYAWALSEVSQSTGLS